jgi:site-specific recombinase XerD
MLELSVESELVPSGDNLPAPLSSDLVVTPDTVARVTRSVPANTARAYRADRAAFTAWCEQDGRTAIPCTPETLTEYAAHLARDDKAPKTIERALSAIRTMHDLAGHPVPSLKGARAVIKDHQTTRAEDGKRTKQAAPILIDDLRKMIDTRSPDTAAGIRDRALIVLGWAMMARRSELAALRLSEVTETADGLEVWVRKSKTDQGANGVAVAIPYGTHPDTCPVRLVRAWTELLTAEGIDDGPLWCSIDRHGNLAGAPTYAGKTSTGLSDRAVAIILQRAAHAANLSNADAITAHSLRAGGASGARRGGADMIEIARHGRWADGSKALLGYIRDVDKWRDNPMRGSGL